MRDDIVKRTAVIPGPEDFVEADRMEEGMPEEERYLYAQNFKIHRLAQEAGWHGSFPGEDGKAN